MLKVRKSQKYDLIKSKISIKKKHFCTETNAVRNKLGWRA